MFRHILIAVCALVISTDVFAQLPDFVALAAQNSPAVVNISTTRTIKAGAGPQVFRFEGPGAQDFNDILQRFMGPGMQGTPEYNAESLGSGFIISPDGYIVTNNHVIREADTIMVGLSDGTDYSAKLVGTDPNSDIALLKITVDHALPVVTFGSSDDLKVGEWVLAIGSPFGFDHSVTQGIVSAKGRGLASDKYVPFIQTDVAINPGSSGGPLLNLDGKVVGMNAQILTRTGGYVGLSFAIPSNVVQDVVDQLKKGGKVQRGWLGVSFQNMDKDLAKSFGLDQPKGALVSEVIPDSPAAKAGMKAGDVILTFGGKPVDGAADLPHLVGFSKPGDSVPLDILRDKKPMKIAVTIAQLKNEDEDEESLDGSAKPESDNKLGLSVRELSLEERQQSGMDGLLITSVTPASPAAKAGLRAGDLIYTINLVPVRTVADFKKQVSGLKAGQTVALLMARRGLGQRYLAINLK